MKTPESFRVQRPPKYVSNPGDGFGAFIVPAHKAPGRRELHIIACDGLDTGWDHVSVSLDNCKSKTPTWEEMCFVKDLFFEPEDCVVQFHPPQSKYVNHHHGVLHLWRQISGTFPLPPKICV